MIIRALYLLELELARARGLQKLRKLVGVAIGFLVRHGLFVILIPVYSRGDGGGAVGISQLRLGNDVEEAILLQASYGLPVGILLIKAIVKVRVVEGLVGGVCDRILLQREGLAGVVLLVEFAIEAQIRPIRRGVHHSNKWMQSNE